MAIELSSTEKEKASPIIGIVFALSFLVFVASLAIFAYFYFVVSKQQQSEINSINTEISKQKASSGYSEEDLLSIGKEVGDYKALMQARAKTSDFFASFEQWIHPQIYFTSFNLDVGSRTVTLSGVARDFQPLIQQIAILKNQPLIERYAVSNIALAETGGVTFSLSLVVSPQVLK
jgi:Tfp pilus assembly protein PilN